MTVIIFLIVLAVLIFVHELGHFLFARMCGIRVDAFKIGFGPKIISWGSGETEYGVNLIPFGGYVKIHGEDPDDESLNGPDASRSFARKPRWQQAIVLLAGVIFNVLFAWLLYAGMFSIGATVPTSAFNLSPDYFSNQRVIVLDAEADSPAIKAGLGIGDVIQSVEVDGKKIDISSISDTQKAIGSSAGKSIKLDYLKNGRLQSVDITPVNGIVSDNYAIGIALDQIAYVHMPFFTAVKESVTYTLSMIKDTVVGLYAFVADLFHGAGALSDIAGPVGIAVIIGNAAHLTFGYLLIVVALISINLAIVNLIPFPALDGGRVLFVIIEGIIRRRISPKFTNAVNTVGFVLLMALMVIVTYKDIVRLVK